MSSLSGKVALVTGGGGGIGSEICASFARAGAKVVVSDITESGKKIADQIIKNGGEAVFQRGDISKESEVVALVDRARKEFGGLDTACNCAALSQNPSALHDYSSETFQHTVTMCLNSVWLCMKHEIIAMLEHGGGSIVNISSIASLSGDPRNSAYAAAKGGVNILTKSAARENATKNIRVNAVLPGVTRTPGLERYFVEKPEIKKHLIGVAPMKRLGEPQEIAEAVIFLSSDQASFITGQLLSVDGGASL